MQHRNNDRLRVIANTIVTPSQSLGHFIPEELPEETTEALQTFFK
jgi:hypothetical protein